MKNYLLRLFFFFLFLISLFLFLSSSFVFSAIIVPPEEGYFFKISVSDGPDPFNPEIERSIIVVKNEGILSCLELRVLIEELNLQWQWSELKPEDSVEIVWDGKDKEGNLVPRGEYTYTALCLETLTPETSKQGTINVFYFVPFSFAIITDLHLGRGYPDYNGEGYDDGKDNEDNNNNNKTEDYYLSQRLEKTINWLLKNKDKIICDNKNNENEKCPLQFLVILGDISDSAEKSELFKTKKILDNLIDPNKDKNLNDSLPYLPLLGNHDIFPYTNDKEAKSPKGEDYFEEVFFNDNENFKLLKQRLNLKRDEKNKKYKNFSFNYQGINFLALDFNSRKPVFSFPKGVGPDAELFKETQKWLKNHLKETPTILFSHHPLIENLIYGFSPREIDVLRKIIKDKNVLANFGGHVHGAYPFVLPHLLEHFMNANKEHSPLEDIKVITTESLMVSGNEEDISNKGIIRIVKINKKKEIDYETIEGKFVALNPYISFTFLKATEILPCVFFKAHAFTKREVFYHWSFGDGKRDSGKWNTHCYQKEGRYNVKLTLIDKETEEEEYLFRKIEAKQGIIPKMIKVAQDLKDKLKLISISLGEDLKTIGQVFKDDVLIKIKKSEAMPVAMITIHFQKAKEDINLEELVIDTDLIQRKSVIYHPNWPKEIEKEKALFIPSTGKGRVYLCPDAKSLEEVNPNCQDKITLKIGETKKGITLTLTEYQNQEYYLLSGIKGTGAGESEEDEESEPELETQISIIQMNYDNENILEKITQDIGDNQAPLLLSELKEAIIGIDLEEYLPEPKKKFYPNQKKKLQMKFKFLETADNQYQGKSIKVNFKFEAIQER